MQLTYVLAVAATGRHGAQGNVQPDNQAWDVPRAAHSGSKNGGHVHAHLQSQEGGILSVSGMQTIVCPPLRPDSWTFSCCRSYSYAYMWLSSLHYLVPVFFFNTMYVLPA